MFNHIIKIILVFLALVVTVGVLTVFRSDIASLWSRLPAVDEILSDIVSRVEVLPSADRVLTPGPLKSRTSLPGKELTSAGIISWTNKHRAEQGLPPLSENLKLKNAAIAKVKDMFALEYFEHVSPNGTGPADLAAGANYQFILIGENLALGNWAGDEMVVDGWMNSPGHRANILNQRFTEIGVYAEKGEFNGQSVWLAAQEFGLPLSYCPPVAEYLAAEIESNEAQLEIWAAELEERKVDLEQTRPKSGPEYNQKIDEYNALAEQYNALLEEVKEDIATYNQSVKDFNTCAAI
ncbi:MAG: hypothetical protein HYS87_03500 [Candidatus Colwellbacteria bacterium]|nr:hypothetical protein [Candidatus Colwellbacteria bacterium]